MCSLSLKERNVHKNEHNEETKTTEMKVVACQLDLLTFSITCKMLTGYLGWIKKNILWYPCHLKKELLQDQETIQDCTVWKRQYIDVLFTCVSSLVISGKQVYKFIDNLLTTFFMYFFFSSFSLQCLERNYQSKIVL